MLLLKQKLFLSKEIKRLFTLQEIDQLLSECVDEKEDVFVNPKTISEAVNSLIGYFDRRNKIDVLLKCLTKSRPDVDWYKTVERNEPSQISPPTHLPQKISSQALLENSPFVSSSESLDRGDSKKALDFFLPLSGIAFNEIIQRDSRFISFLGESGSGKTHLALSLKQICNEENILFVPYSTRSWEIHARNGINNQNKITSIDHLFSLIKELIQTVSVLECPDLNFDEWRRELDLTDNSRIREQATIHTRKRHRRDTERQHIFDKILLTLSDKTKYHRVVFVADDFLNLDDEDGACLCASELFRIFAGNHFSNKIKLVLLGPGSLRGKIQGINSANCFTLPSSLTNNQISLLINKRIKIAYPEFNKLSDFFINDHISPEDEFGSIEKDVLELVRLFAKIDGSEGLVTPRQVVQFMQIILKTIAYHCYEGIPVPKGKWRRVKKEVKEHLFAQLIQKTPVSKRRLRIEQINNIDRFFFYKLQLKIQLSEESDDLQNLKRLITTPKTRIHAKDSLAIRNRLKILLNESLEGFDLGDAFFRKSDLPYVSLPNPPEIETRMKRKPSGLFIIASVMQDPIIEDISKSFQGKHVEERINVIQGFAGTGKSECLNAIKAKLKNSQSRINCLGLWDMEKDLDSSFQDFVLKMKHKAQNVSGKKVVLLDNVDAWLKTRDQQLERIPFELWEKKLVRALLYQSKDIFVVVTTSRQLCWNDPDVTLNIRLHELKSPTLEKIRNIKKKQVTKEIEESYPFAFGYMWAMAQLERTPDSKQSDIVQSATFFVKEQIAENARDIVPEIAIAPLLNIPLLRRLVKLDSSEITHGKAVELLDCLLKCGLLIPLNDISAYRFADGGIRRLLMREFRNIRSDEYFEKHKQAEEYFQMQSRYVGSLHRSIVGAMYHTAVLGHSSGNALLKCQEWIAQNKDNLEGADRRGVLEAWTTSDDDPHLKEELMEILGEDGFKMITKSLETALG